MEHLLVQYFALATAAILGVLGLCVLVSRLLTRKRRAGSGSSHHRHGAGQRLAILRAGTGSPSPNCSANQRSDATPLAPVDVPERLSRDQQWDRAAGVVAEALARVEEIKALQLSAEHHLDSATYAIQCLFTELSAVAAPPDQIADAPAALLRASSGPTTASGSFHQISLSPSGERQTAAIAA
ncbi:MAG: hypothetical protein CTY20_04460 [Hyphomicrobium sp.]|nr:MAG: hypothetical protein CTY20_04460 [Hyphomicrobium sp.]